MPSAGFTHFSPFFIVYLALPPWTWGGGGSRKWTHFVFLALWPPGMVSSWLVFLWSNIDLVLIRQAP